MRAVVQRIYLILVRGLGLYGAGLVLWYFVNMPSQIEQGLFVQGPIFMAVVGLVVSATLLVPRMTPGFLARPSRMMHLLPVLVIHGLLTLVFCILCLLVSVSLGLPDDQGKAMAIGLAVVPVLITVVLGWVGMTLCIWPPSDGSDTIRHHVIAPSALQSAGRAAPELGARRVS